VPFIPNYIERLLILSLNKAPGPLLDIASGVALRALGIALKLGVFEKLENGALTTIELASQVKASEQGIRAIVGVLESFRYVSIKSDGKISNTKMTSKWLIQSSPVSFCNYVIMWQDIAFPFWDKQFEKAIVEGKSDLSLYQWLNDQKTASSRLFQEAMMETSRLFADDVINKVRIPPGSRKLLDIGGGHGLYSVKFCRKYPELAATIIDAPAALEIARDNIAKEKFGSRINIQPGNYMTDSFGSEDYDVALLFNVIHAHTPEENVGLLRKVAEVLGTRGMVVLLSLVSDNAAGPTANSLQKSSALTFFVNFGGSIYKSEEVQSWLTQAGYAYTKKIGLRNAPAIKLLIGQKKKS
jgi:cyclopropane fatty-acyl-phospholipid synthase-like methyltransferase